MALTRFAANKQDSFILLLGYFLETRDILDSLLSRESIYESDSFLVDSARRASFKQEVLDSTLVCWLYSGVLFPLNGIHRDSVRERILKENIVHTHGLEGRHESKTDTDPIWYIRLRYQTGPLQDANCLFRNKARQNVRWIRYGGLKELLRLSRYAISGGMSDRGLKHYTDSAVALSRSYLSRYEGLLERPSLYPRQDQGVL